LQQSSPRPFPFTQNCSTWNNFACAAEIAGVSILQFALAGRTEALERLKIGKYRSEKFHVEQFAGW
jgi:hypothetical protein